MTTVGVKRPILAGLNRGINAGSSFCGEQGARKLPGTSVLVSITHERPRTKILCANQVAFAVEGHKKVWVMMELMERLRNVQRSTRRREIRRAVAFLGSAKASDEKQRVKNVRFLLAAVLRKKSI